MTIYQIEAIECIKKIYQCIESLEDQIASGHHQKSYVENCKNYIASHKAQIEFLQKEYKV